MSAVYGRHAWVSVGWQRVPVDQVSCMDAPPDDIRHLVCHSQCGSIAMSDVALCEDVPIVSTLFEDAQAAGIVVSWRGAHRLQFAV